MNFDEFYEKVHGNRPFPWQSRLAAQVCAGSWPKAIALPTAAGKTACIDIAVFALASGAKEAPRRIFFVVDRRIVVDQAYRHAEDLAKVLDRAAEGVLLEVADQLRNRAEPGLKMPDRASEGVPPEVADQQRKQAEPGWLDISKVDRFRILEKRWAILDEVDAKKQQNLIDKLSDLERQWFDVRPLDVYALRGGMYRETAWTRSPLQPTVIASTVDQVGSRLLFRGYGVSDSMKPVHAGLVGNDALILLDEAHCAKPFQQTAEAVKHYRKWKNRPAEAECDNHNLTESAAPFQFITITATPTDEIRKEEEKRALEHPEEPKMIFEADSLDRDHKILGERIKASKPAKLMLAKKNKLLDVLKEQAEKLMGNDLGTDKHGVAHNVRAVGIIVNRVKSARELAKLLSEVKTKKGEVALPHDVILLTGRMRPVDRDIVFKQLAPLFSGSKTKLERPTFVVATQCLEVGADLDFHALVTECASLDSLRQRFGRLNRVADRPSAKAVVICREEFCEPKEKEKEQDPIYGNSLPNTWKFLTDEGKRTEFDFGVSAMEAAVTGVDLTEMNAPSADAPVLFPAHLDCWVQTNPIPTPDPDPALFLHGPKQPGQPDVQVVFRDDLGEEKKYWAEIVGLCPPSSSEAVAVPISLFKKWLAGESFEDNTGDVEGGTLDEEKEIELKEPQTALCWKGPESEETDTIEDPKDVRANRTYVVSCNAKNVGKLGDFATDPPTDYAEEAFLKSRDKALLRFSDLDLDEESETFDDDLSEAIRTKIAKEYPGWHERAIQSLTAKKKRIVETYPAPLKGFVVRSKKRLGLCDPTYLDDSEPGDSFKGEPVKLVDHSRGVAECAAKFAAGCGLPVELYYQAGLLHDLGKLDPRFQAMLRQSSPRTAVGTPLAKSANGPRNKRERDETQLVHRYPSGARHELLSCAILESSDDDLMHLIATHHGSARPFADAVEENDAASSFGVDLFKFNREMPTSKQEIAKWNAELPERFWRMVRKHGWWGSAYREAVFRLADHAQSREEQEGDWKLAAVKALPVATFTMKESKEPSYPLPLPGLDGSNPLAFLAALGTLRLANRAFPGTRLSWESRGTWSAVLHLPQEVPPDELVDALLKNAGVGRRCVSFAPDLKIAASEFQNFEREAVGYAEEDRDFADFLRAFADPLVTIQAGPNAGKTKPTEFYLIAGQQKMLKQALEIAAAASVSHLHKCLFDQWVYDDPIDGLSLRWDPQDDFRYATRFYNPSKDRSKGKRGSVLGAHRLAFEGLPFFPCFAVGTRLATTGFTNLQRRPFFSWPLWSAQWGVDAVRSVLTSIEPPKAKAKIQQVVMPKQLGVNAWYQCEKVPNSDYFNFTPAQVI